MEFKMPADAHPAGVRLRVKELDRALSFYTGLLGLEQQSKDGAGTAGPAVRLAPGGELFFLDLVEEVDAPLRPYPSVGLYHFALLLPDRPSLASVFRKLVNAGWDFEGAADHGVSEALYLRDPEKNGIELYRDRPMDAWRLVDGRVAMVTEPLDVYGLLDEAQGAASLHGDTRLGHMHLHVDDLDRSAGFYTHTLGLNNRASMPGASFLAAGDYHHHLGLNTWAGTRQAPSAATGLLGYTWALPEGAGDELSRAVEDQGVPVESSGGSLVISDPIGVELTFSEEDRPPGVPGGGGA